MSETTDESTEVPGSNPLAHLLAEQKTETKEEVLTPSQEFLTKVEEATKDLLPPPSTPTVQEVTQSTEPSSQTAPVVDPDQQIVDALSGYIHDPLDETPWTKVLFYGDMGSGKTKAACDAPGALLVAIERGQSTLLNHPDILANGIKVMTFKSVQQVTDLAEMIKRGHFPEFETIILDTFSELQYMALDNRIEAKYNLSPHTRDPYTPEGKDYQGNTGHMRRIAASYRDIPRNVIFTCHERDDEVGPAKAIVRRPSPTAQVNKALGQYCDVVAYMYNEVDTENVEHFYTVTRTTQTMEARIIAKTRIKSIPVLSEDLSFAKIHQAKLDRIEQIKKERANS